MSNLDLPLITFTSQHHSGPVEVEITARQITEPLPGPGGLHVVWTVSRGLAEVRPRIGNFEARQQFVVFFEGRESGGSGNVWSVAEATDVRDNTKYLIGTGKSAGEAFDNFCERAATLLSVSPQAQQLADRYGDAETVGNMRTQAARCFKVRE